MFRFIRRSIHHGMPKQSETFLKIGDVRVPVAETVKNIEHVPVGYADTNVPQSIVQAIKWMLKKDLLKQDIFLIGTPGYFRSQIVFQFLEMCNREFEYLPISRDTTEADIKQRREIKSGNVFYSDLCAVRAALNGRVLVIDGVEKAERNVLPILNNLLENREMQLDDGRFLMAARKYDKLLEKYSVKQLKEWKLERVSPNFQVVALGLPIPTFHGHTLDPPLRSRFQCRNITHLPFDTMSNIALRLAPNVPAKRVENLLALVYALLSQNQKTLQLTDSVKKQDHFQLQLEKTSELSSLPLFPVENLLKAVRIWNNNHQYTEEFIFGLCYPSSTILKADSQQPILKTFFKKFLITSTQRKTQNILSIENNAVSASSLLATSIDNKNFSAQVKISGLSGDSTFRVNTGGNLSNTSKSNFVSTTELECLLADLMLTHSESDFCILGARGSGKSVLVREFARRLGYSVETMILYQDMNSRELVQQRRILPNGDTIWEDSQLVKAAKNGSLCVLDGLERVHWSMIELLGTLIHHRFLQLPDGSRLIGAENFELLQQKSGLNEQELNEKKVYKIQRSFRLIGLGDSESANASIKWLNEQILSLFLFHVLRPLSIEDEMKIISQLVPNVCQKIAKQLLTLTHNLRASHDLAVRGIANSLSLRKILFILQRYSNNSSESIFDLVNRAALARFLPTVVREAFEEKVREAGILPLIFGQNDDLTTKNLDWADDLIKLNDGRAKNWSPYDEAMVPDIVFFDNKQHLSIMEDMSKDFFIGTHLLLIGNQGVGKNKIVDRFLQLIKRPRQYMQLHRDTTVQSLTVQATVVNGKLQYEDSPLVKAVKEGFVLVVDEADKAPLHVIAVLKSLLDSGVLYLSDGRVIQPQFDSTVVDEDNIIRIHKDFRIVMLANRPGFPFLGNDLFGVLGDLFSVHVVDNPLPSSELVMVKDYGPDVPINILEALVGVFGDLRQMTDQSLLSYPYSTRELVNIVKHLQMFPHEEIDEVIRNVFDFDSYSSDTIDTIQRVFEQRGFVLDNGESQGWWGKIVRGSAKSSSGAPERIEYEKKMSEFNLSKLDTPKFGKVDPKNTPHVGGNTWAGGTGGYNTAGLGGVGGPFRLDAGHDVHQLPDEAKKQVPEHILKKAREIAQQEYAKKLKEIEMSEYDANAYNELYEKIGKQVKMFCAIVDSLEEREHERKWAKHQTSGDLDDGKLIEGMTGEKTIYRRRVEEKPDPGTNLLKPKRIRLCFDVSGSMYRFNGLDQRLQRSMEAALLVIESFEGKQDKIKYDLVGHSGESAEVPFISADNLPINAKQKIDVLKRMVAHTQYCWSGDHTLQAIYRAIGEVKQERDVDERFVIVLSDANLERYGITPGHLTKALNSDETVNAFLILIGSLGQQAVNIQRALPKGKAFVAGNAAEIPRIMQKIFSTTIIK